MNRNELYLIGDYVHYEGDNSIASGLLRNPAIGRIKEFHEFFDRERVLLLLLNKNETIWCDYDKIRPIYISKSVLEKVGFIETVNNTRKRYQMGNITISDCAINILSQRLLIKSGYCAADFTNGIPNIEKYYESGDFNLKLFHIDFPSVHNINSLFLYLGQRGIYIDEQEILCG